VSRLLIEETVINCVVAGERLSVPGRIIEETGLIVLARILDSGSIVDVGELGEGVDDFVQMPADSHSGVFYVPDQSLSPRIARRVWGIVSCLNPAGGKFY